MTKPRRPEYENFFPIIFFRLSSLQILWKFETFFLLEKITLYNLSISHTRNKKKFPQIFAMRTWKNFFYYSLSELICSHTIKIFFIFQRAAGYLFSRNSLSNWVSESRASWFCIFFFGPHIHINSRQKTAENASDRANERNMNENDTNLRKYERRKETLLFCIRIITIYEFMLWWSISINLNSTKLHHLSDVIIFLRYMQRFKIKSKKEHKINFRRDLRHFKNRNIRTMKEILHNRLECEMFLLRQIECRSRRIWHENI